MRGSLFCAVLALCCLLATAIISEEPEREDAPKGVGTTYVRWGRTTCNNGAEVVYKGYIAGGMYNKMGSGSNLLCLHQTPQWGRTVPGVQGYSGLYGSEYRIHDPYGRNAPFSYENLGGQDDLLCQDALCVVCLVPKSTHTLMIPGRQDCGAGLNLEYKGYLMSAYRVDHPGDYICVDEAPEVREGGKSDTLQNLLYPVEVTCGTLPCSQFPNGNEVTCAVCSV